MKWRCVGVMLATVLLCQVCVAVDFWEKKTYGQWSKGDTQRLLENSPWAQQVTLSTVNVNVSQRNMSSTLARGSLGAEGAARENTPRITYTVQLRSAQIVRQAVVRLSQIDSKYEDMQPEQRAKFDAKTAKFIAMKNDVVVAHVIFGSNVPSIMSDLHTLWQRITPDLLKSNTFLNAGGKKLALLDFVIVSDDAFELIFERPANVAPDANFNVEFQAPNPSGTMEKVLAEFKPKKMMVNGEMQY